MEHNDDDQRSISGPERLNGDTQNATNSTDAADSSLQQALARLGLSKKDALPEVDVDRLSEALDSPAWSERLAAVQTLRSMGDQAPLELALRGIADEQSDVRAVSAYVLGALGEEAPQEPLIAALRDSDWHVRAASAQALGRQRKESIPLDALLSTLDDKDESVRAAAVSALSRAKDAPIAPLLAAMNDQSWLVREAAVLALGALGEQARVTQLIATRADEDAPVREAAALVREFGTQSIQRPVGSYEGSLQILALIFSKLAVRIKILSRRHVRVDQFERDIELPLPGRGHYPLRGEQNSFSRFVEGSLAILVIAALVISWLALAHLPRKPSVGGQQTTPTALIYRSYTGSIYGGVYKIAWSPDGTRIASINVDGSMRVWEAGTGRTLANYTSPVSFVKVLSMVWLPNNYLLVLSERVDNTIDAWNALTGLQYMSMTLPDTIYAGAWSPDGTRIAFDDGHHEIQVWNVNPKRHISSYTVHTIARITALAWSSDGKQIASATYDGTIQVWNPATSKNVSSPYTNAGQLISLAWSPDRSHLASATSDGMVQVWITNHNNPPTLRQATGTVMPVVALSWSPDGSYLAASNADVVQVWDTVTGKMVITYRGHADGINDLAWSPSGTKIASASLDKTVQVWQIS